MNSKQVAKKLAKMTTRSESANAPEPVVSETEKSRPPAPFRESTEGPSDRHIYIFFLLFFELYKRVIYLQSSGLILKLKFQIKT